MGLETIPIFDGAAMAAELDGDRDLLHEIVKIHRRKIEVAAEDLRRLTFCANGVRRIAARIAEAAGRIHACRLEALARRVVELDGEPGPLAEAVPRLEREARVFLAETRLVI